MYSCYRIPYITIARVQWLPYTIHWHSLLHHTPYTMARVQVQPLYNHCAAFVQPLHSLCTLFTQPFYTAFALPLHSLCAAYVLRRVSLCSLIRTPVVKQLKNIDFCSSFLIFFYFTSHRSGFKWSANKDPIWNYGNAAIFHRTNRSCRGVFYCCDSRRSHLYVRLV